MTALISFLAILVLSTLAVRVATVALTMTGISRDVAHFQALSAFTGVGFTTEEAETIINHPLRRRIISYVIRLGNLGLVTTVASLLLTFVGLDSAGQRFSRLIILIIALIVLGLMAISRPLDRVLSRIIRRVLSRWSDFNIKLQDYEAILNLTNGYGVGEVVVQEDSWVAEKTLAEAQLHKEGIIVLGITRDDGSYVGAPQAETRVCVGDQLILYGQEENIADLDMRLTGSTGDASHVQAVQNQSERVRQQEAEDTYSQTA